MGTQSKQYVTLAAFSLAFFASHVVHAQTPPNAAAPQPETVAEPPAPVTEATPPAGDATPVENQAAQSAPAQPTGEATPATAGATRPPAATGAPLATAPVAIAPAREATTTEAPVDAPSTSAASDNNPLAPAGDAHNAGDHALSDKTRFRMGKGLAFESADGDFALIPRLRAQLRYSFAKEAENDAEHLVQLRRARLQFTGHLYGKNNKFKVELAFSPRDVGSRNGGPPSTSPLLDWYFDFTHSKNASLRVGQYKVPFNRQRLVSSGNLQMVDRSIINSEFNLDRDLGLDLRSKDFLGLDLFRYYVGIFAGEGRNKNVADSFAMMYLARLEVLPLGMFRDFSEGDQKRLGKPKLALGVAYGHVEDAKKNRGIGGSTPADGGTTDVDAVTWDAIFKYSGLSVQTEWAWRTGKRNPGSAEDEDGDAIAEEAPRDGLGGMLQVGYLFPQSRFELAARAGSVWSGEDSSLNDQEEYGAAASYYFARHPFKLQADYFRMRSSDDNRDSWEESDNVRLQLQASF